LPDICAQRLKADSASESLVEKLKSLQQARAVGRHKLLLTARHGALYRKPCRHEAWKPVRVRHGRATVIGSVEKPGRESDPLVVRRGRPWNAFLIAAAAYLIVMVLVGLVLPPINEVPAEFPAVVLWRFRIASVGAQVIMWMTLGLSFGALTERVAATTRPGLQSKKRAF
jgi:hypothetical protein